MLSSTPFDRQVDPAFRTTRRVFQVSCVGRDSRWVAPHLGFCCSPPVSSSPPCYTSPHGKSVCISTSLVFPQYCQSNVGHTGTRWALFTVLPLAESKDPKHPWFPPKSDYGQIQSGPFSLSSNCRLWVGSKHRAIPERVLNMPKGCVHAVSTPIGHWVVVSKKHTRKAGKCPVLPEAISKVFSPMRKIGSMAFVCSRLGHACHF